MIKKKVLLIFGTRPEAIKMAPVYLELKQYFDVKLCVTGQHRKMLDQVLKLFNIIPDYDLNIMKFNQEISDTIYKITKKVKPILDIEKPKIVLVHGDTTTSMAAAITAFSKSILVGHVEAGLRTNNLKSPFPEEFNRQVTSRVAKWHFAPTELSRENLIAERVENSNKFWILGNQPIHMLF